MHQDRLSNIFLFAATALTLVYVWSTHWFVTTDGPSHAYNAWLIGERLFNDGWAEGFGRFLQVSAFPSPNWTGHAMLAILVQFLDVATSEKLIFSLYVVLYMWGQDHLARSMKLHRGMFVALMWLFVFPKTFLAGFYNYNLGLALMAWCLGVFWQYREALMGANETKKVLRIGLVLLLWSLLLFFTHVLPFLLFLAFVGFVFLGDAINGNTRRWKSLAFYFVPSMPATMLLLTFLLSTASAGGGIGTEPFKALWHGFLELNAMHHYDGHLEKEIFIAVAALVGLLCAYSLWRSGRAVAVAGVAFLGMMALMVLFYFLQPAAFGGAGILSFRIQFLAYLFAIGIIGMHSWPKTLSIGLWGIAFLFQAVLFVHRQPFKARASLAMDELLEARLHLTPGESTVALSCHHNGFLDGEVIAPDAWVFTHCTDYLMQASEQLSIVNYESHLFHFPVHWRSSFVAYNDLSCMEGLENIPPCLEFQATKAHLYPRVDNVVFVFPEAEGIDRAPQWLETMKHIEQDFIRTFRSKTGVVHVYSRREGV